MKTRSLIVGTLLLSACTTAGVKPDAEAAKALETRPVVPALKPFVAPAPAVIQLPSGMTLIVVQRPGDPLETLAWANHRGTAADGSKPGLASLTMEMLQAGSAGKTADQIAEEANALGTTLSAGAERDGVEFEITVLPEKTAGAVALLADVALRPNMDPKEFARVKTEVQAKNVSTLADPHFVAEEVFDAAIYGAAHPYGSPEQGTDASLAALTLEDVKAFYGSLAPDLSVIVAAGGMSAGDVSALVKASFAGPAKPGARVAVPPPPSTRPGLLLVDKADAPQSMLRFGLPGPAGTTSQRIALELGNIILGGSFTSRLSANLREKHGYTYGAGSRFDFGAAGRPWHASTAVKSDVTGEAIVELKAEVARMAATGIDATELAKAKALYLDGLVQSLQTSNNMADLLVSLWMQGRPVDALSHVVADLDAIHEADVNAAMKQALLPDQMTLVIVGDAKTVAPQLAKSNVGTPARWTDDGHLPRPLK